MGAFGFRIALRSFPLMATALLGVPSLASHAWGTPPGNDPPKLAGQSGPSGNTRDTKKGGDIEGMEGFDEASETPKPAAPKQDRFDPKAFFAAWGTKNPEFDHDGSGTVDCPDLEFAIRAAGGGRTPAKAGKIILTTSAAKEGTINARGALPSTLVKAWGTSATNFDFDGNGIVGCGDVPGFIANDLKPIAPGQKAPQAPATAPKTSSADPSVKVPNPPPSGGDAAGAAGVTGTVGKSVGATGTGKGTKRTSGGGVGGGGAAGAGEGAAAQGSAESRSGQAPPSQPPSSTNSGSGSDRPGGIAGGGNGGGGAPPQAGRGEVSIRYRAGTPGGKDESVFTWVVVGVRESGTFVDGTPWITVAPGAELVDLSPKSIRRRTSGGFQVWTSGSAKNPRARRYIDVQTLTGTVECGGAFDGRTTRMKPPTQADIDADYDETSNIGIVRPGKRAIDPVPLVPGDVIVTADSEWIENDDRVWGSGDGVAVHASPGRRTGIKRFGVLTVLREAPTETCFRPPLQWIRGDEANRPAPIPVARVRSDERALLHNTPRLRANPDQLLGGPTFHDGGGIVYQSSHAIYALTTDLAGGQNVTYGGNLAVQVLGPALLHATNTGEPSDRRERIRNRLIQYGIDCHGCVLSLVQTSAGAGQRAAELKPWIILAGWWLDRPSMQNPYQALRDRYPGTPLAALTDAEIGIRFFHDDHVCRQVVPGMGLGLVQRWGPSQRFRVTSASNVGSTNLCGMQEVKGLFGHLEVNGVELGGDSHARKPFNFFNRYLKIESGAGAGPTLYRVLRVGGNEAFSDWIEVDRPWAHGMPNGTSAVCMYPFRNGEAVPGDLADVGRWYYSREGQKGMFQADDMSPVSDGYAAVSAKAFITPYAALKCLADRTGNRDFTRGTTWNWLSEIVGGTGTTPSGERFGSCPDSERIGNLFWDKREYLGGIPFPVLKQWMGVTDAPRTWGAKDFTRLPGFHP